jgi:hypothetical protein
MFIRKKSGSKIQSILILYVLLNIGTASAQPYTRTFLKKLIEHVIARFISDNGMKNLVIPRPGLVEPVPGELRVPRERMFEIANLYFDAIEQDKGSVAPFADDCERHENGTQTTTNKQPDPADFGDSKEEQLRLAMARIDACGCAKQIDAQNLSYITRIQPRRLTIIDEKLGLVFGFPMFVHKGDVQSIKIIGVPGVDTIPKKFPPFNLQAGEIFKISGGQIHEIEARISHLRSMKKTIYQEILNPDRYSVLY